MKKIQHILLFSLISILLFTVSSCNIEKKENISTIQVKKSTNLFSGKVFFPDVELKFKLNATLSNIAPRSVITLNYPLDYSDQELKGSVIATGLSDTKGNFTLDSNSDFTPKENEVYILEASKRLKGVGFDNIGLRTNVKWNGKIWESINKNGLFIDSKTTALSIIQSLNPNIVNPLDTIKSMSFPNINTTILETENTQYYEDITISDINNNLKAYVIKNVSNLVERALKENKDPFSSIAFMNGEYYIIEDKAQNNLLTGCLGNPSNCI
ncbi:MAG: hypothetical protein AABZ74_18070 [Cyanobacteriota bacterium]